MGRVEGDGNAGEILEESPAGLYDLCYDYWISQFPVTVAQFRAYIESEKIEFEHPYYLRQPDNTPMVAIEQVEAVAFCEWLTKRWQADGKLSAQWRVTLANEPEWEKAARGGQQLLAVPVVYSANDGCFDNRCEDKTMIANPNPQRVYASGDDINHDIVSYGMHINSVTAKGVYPLGVSPYGCHDMNGNVFEWTRFEMSEYPFPAVGTEAWKEQESQEQKSSVLRGGCFSSDVSNVRCALRDLYVPLGRSPLVGFRVVLSPYI